MTLTDKINPKHYDGDACMRCIARMTKNMSGPMGFCVGQAVKYLWRAGSKPGELSDDDKGKAYWYLDWIRCNDTESLRSRIRRALHLDFRRDHFPTILLDLAKMTSGTMSADELRPLLVELAERQ